MAENFFEAKKWVLYSLFAATSLTGTGFANGLNSSPKEALMLRRITEYWKDGDYATVKRQILDFLEKNPDSALHDHLHAMLGDLYFQERNFRQALATYDLIGNPEIREKTFFNHLQAHFEMRDYSAVIQKSESYLKLQRDSHDPLEMKVRYLFAEAAFRQALNCKEVEQKEFYLKLAKPQYKLLTQTKYSERALFPLAEIHRLLRENERAAALYLSLGEKYPEHRERFLFQAAILQIQVNKKEAIETFQQVRNMGGKRSRLAAFNQLILLYQTEKYEEFLQLHEQVIAKMPDDKVPLLHFYEGRCHYYLGDYSQAVLPLENFITNTKGRTKELKTAYLLLVNCSRHLKDISLLERTLYSYKTTFPKDGELAKVLMIHAQMCRENGQFTQALTDLKTLMTEYPNYQDRESVAYDHALLLTHMEKWDEAKEAFLTFLDQYPHSEKKVGAWRHLLNCCIAEVQNTNQTLSKDSKELLAKVISQALHHDQVLSPQEKEQFSLVLMKCQCELGHYDQVIPMLSQYIVDTKEPRLLADAHLLMAICQQKTNSDLGPFIQHAELALTHNPKMAEGKVLHLELYNAYLSKGFEAVEDKNRLFHFNSAASHLFASDAWKDRNIKLDNYLWLVHHYYHSAIEGERDAIEKANILFKDLLGIEKEESTLNISADSLYLEAEVMKYAHLLETTKQHKEQIALLEKLTRRQEEKKELPWKLKRRATLDLARAYENDRQYQNALISYRYLVKTADRTTTTVTQTAQLHLALLEYALLKPQQRTSESPEVISTLHTLKDLQIQKKVASEPLHLEAALRYAEIRAYLLDPQSQAKNAHFFYKRMVDDFNSSPDDPILEEYKNKLSHNAEKQAVFKAYMRYLDGQMLQKQAEIARQEKKLNKASELDAEALTIYNSLLENERSLQPYLLDRVKRAKEEINRA